MDILWPAIILGGVGLILGILIFIVGKVFYVEEDPSIQEVVDILPRYNCGACGYPGCKEMAGALLKKEAEPAQCKPMKKEQIEVLKEYLKKHFAEKA